MIGYRFRAVRRRLLEYGRASPMREPLACLFTSARAVCKRGKRGFAACRGHCSGVSATGRPQPSVTPACPTSPWNYGTLAAAHLRGRSDKRGCIGTVEGVPAIYRRVPSSLSSKILNIRRRRRQLDSLRVYRRPPRTSAGQPAVLTAPPPIYIRVSNADRHENRNR